MSSANIGWLFNKDYFKDIDYSRLDSPQNEKKIQDKVSKIITQTPHIEEAEVLGNTHFSAKTTYPGLLLGSGNAHELPDIKGQAILGFHFDYTSGLPVMQGSSVKGVLRSAFKHHEYIQELLINTEIDVEILEDEIFNNNDIFFDATISKAEGKILSDDYITPHADELKDPIPLRFIKVLPNVSFRFDFELSDGLISKEEKKFLFANILLDLGIGAKTNVGYGKFKDDMIEGIEEDILKQSRKDERDKINSKIENADNIADKCKAIIEKSSKINEDLFKKLRYESMENDDKSEIKNYFETKYPAGNGKWFNKITKLLL